MQRVGCPYAHPWHPWVQAHHTSVLHIQHHEPAERHGQHLMGACLPRANDKDNHLKIFYGHTPWVHLGMSTYDLLSQIWKCFMVMPDSNLGCWHDIGVFVLVSGLQTCLAAIEFLKHIMQTQTCHHGVWMSVCFGLRRALHMVFSQGVTPISYVGIGCHLHS